MYAECLAGRPESEHFFMFLITHLQVGWTAGAACPNITDLPACKQVILPHYTQFYGEKQQQSKTRRKANFSTVEIKILNSLPAYFSWPSQSFIIILWHRIPFIIATDLDTHSFTTVMKDQVRQSIITINKITCIH